MDKNKSRTDLLAAGRKKFQQYRKKKDNKGGSSSQGGKPSSKKAEKDPDPDTDELAKITEQESVDADAVSAGKLDPPIAVQCAESDHACVAGDDSNGVREDRKDLTEEASVEPSVDSRGSRSDIEIDREDAEHSGLEKFSDVDLDIGTSMVDKQSNGVLVNVSEEEVLVNAIEEEVGALQPSSGLADDCVNKVSNLKEMNDEELGPKCPNENSDSVVIREEGSDTLESFQLGRPQAENGLLSTSEAIQPMDINVLGDRVAIQHMDSEISEENCKNTSLEEDKEAAISSEFTSHDGLEEKVEDFFSCSVTHEPTTEHSVDEQRGGNADDHRGKESANEETTLPQPLLLEPLGAQSESIWELEKTVDVLSPGEKVEDVKEDQTLLMSDFMRSDLKEGSFGDGIESIRRHLYVTNIDRHYLQLLLDEQTDINLDIVRHYSVEVSKLRALVKETGESKRMVDEELSHCNSQLQALKIEKEELEISYASAKHEIVACSNRCLELQHKLEFSQQELESVSAELASCRTLLEALQLENTKFEEEKAFLYSENSKLASLLLEKEERLLLAFDKNKQLESNVKETWTHFEQLIEENLDLFISLDMYKVKIEELANESSMLAPEACKVTDSNNSHVDGEASNAQDPLVQKVDDEEVGNSGILRVLKGHIEEAKSILENVEKSIHGMHSHSTSLSRRATASGVSKLIQAFELKTNQIDDPSEEAQTNSLKQSDDSYSLSKEQTRLLGDKLKQMELYLGKLEVNLLDEFSSRELVKKFETETEALGKQNNVLQVKVDELVGLLGNYEERIGVLQEQFDHMHRGAISEGERLSSTTEMLQKEVHERVSVLRNERDSLKGLIVEAIEKLSSSTGSLVPKDLDVGINMLTLIDAATKLIQSLHEKLDAAQVNHDFLSTSYVELNKIVADLHRRNELATGQVKKMCYSLSELLHDSCEDIHEIETYENSAEAQEALYIHYEGFLEHLRKMLAERLLLLSKNNELEASLLNKTEEFEELKLRSNALSEKANELCHVKSKLQSILMSKIVAFGEPNTSSFVLAKELDENDVVVENSDNEESKLLNSLFSRLEASLALHYQKYEEAIEQINLLSASNIQLETEMQVLKGSLNKLEEALEASHSVLNLKVSELEQSEQRVSSLKEKLSIAVAKGKGLVVQRDSLKQSLMEKSSELEKCLQELQSKEAHFKEVEAKLKSYSEADRIEALESELSYIRNSATALRDSFLLKDSVLQKIEEVLEDLDFPEHFHSRDIVEKVELLSKMAAANSLPLTEWDQKSSMGGSHSDRDDVQMSSLSGLEELRSRYDELQRKFYGLAEHNDMLEQSLVERNSLIQKWEEVLNRISMPPQLKSLEPEDRIEWLANTLSEVQRERDALQSKIENLEVSSEMLTEVLNQIDIPPHLKTMEPGDRIEWLASTLSDVQKERDALQSKIESLEDSSEMLIVDLEESHKKISELTAEILAVKTQKDFFSESLEKLRFEYLALSERAVQDEIDRGNLQKELAELHEKMVEKIGNDEIYKLIDLINNAFPDGDSLDVLSGSTATEYLEALLQEFINKYKTLSSSRFVNEVSEEVVSEDRNLVVDTGASSEADLDDNEQKLMPLRLELDEATRTLDLVKGERDQAVEKFQPLVLEIEELSKERDILHEKCRSLELEVETVSKQRDGLKEQLIQEEQKTASTREKLNVAVRKGKGLVQQRDSLKQSIEEMNAVLEKLKSKHDQQIKALESEKSLLMNRLAEREQILNDNKLTLNKFLTALHSIDAGGDCNTIDPVQKIEEIAKFCHDLSKKVASSEAEAQKSKKAAGLLLNELNEVQERADILQEELASTEATIIEFSRQRDALEAARTDALHRLEQVNLNHSQERKETAYYLSELHSSIDQLRKVCFDISSCVVNVFTREVDFIAYVETLMDSASKQIDSAHFVELPVVSFNGFCSSNPMNEKSHSSDALFNVNIHGSDDSSIVEHVATVHNAVIECMSEFDHLKRNVDHHTSSIDQHAMRLLKSVEFVQTKVASEKEKTVSLKRDLLGLESRMKEKEAESFSTQKNLSLLYEACSTSLAEIGSLTSGESLRNTGHLISLTDNEIRLIADRLMATIKGISNKSEITELQRQLQEKDIQMNQICTELVSQIRDAETVAKKFSVDLDYAKEKIHNLEKQIEAKENDKRILEQRVKELEGMEALSTELQVKFKSLTDVLTAKDQEIEGLMQALDEEETQMEELDKRKRELEGLVQEKDFTLKSLEVSRAKTVAKLSTTVNKFDELHNLSETLIAEVENLQSQLQGRDLEISFLRQEVTKSTNDLLALQEANKKYSSEIDDLLGWLDKMVLIFGLNVKISDGSEGTSQVHVYKNILDEQIVSVITELNDLRVSVQNKDALLQIERGRVEELLHRSEALETSLRQKEQSSSRTLVPSEIEQVRDKLNPGAVVAHVRSGRKVNNDQVAISIDTENDDHSLHDDDDDKAHGFKSLVMSRFVPRATRPISDRIDGIWVSGDRLLMRQPTLRLGVLIYWIALHALLASFI
uniref:Uncharacterized protein n=1 Tax=Ananas comosus var. bracteatus TaxID=296719 RepID=A0A6V7P449_ANACO|nr:unnamed protein product [Ananas comosus var. bracteatus]